ncbi:8-amino-7-oxononanoate synthase [Aciduricibacillus chroicocephali]|uniref:8-amino-7-ketopelargonate synthase n=1 Tax=Aciduricibacillus chroicocephali TaxID=3054939 RepID=A0ABY9KTX2_9BACI|nr:8-amino-7-oxononanoate synthase [Bacillaceae bacterium 44XB]
MKDWETDIRLELEKLAEQKLQRHLRTSRQSKGAKIEHEGKLLLNLASNDYLGLAGDERLLEAQVKAAERYGAGAGASRLVTGSHPLYEATEQALIAWKGTEGALICGSGYTANIGVLSSLLSRHDVVFSDRLNHASIIDGILLSRAEHKRYRHNDMGHLEKLLQKTPEGKRKLIVTDSVFSMDGDTANLDELVRLKEKYGALLVVDEAHAGGVFGPEGKGLCAALGVDEAVDIQIGTFSKAFGSYGAYITGKRWLIDFLVNRMRSLIYTTALPPAVLGSAMESLQIIRDEDWRREKLQRNADYLRRKLIEAGFHTYESMTQIIPVRIGENEQAIQFSKELQEAGISAIAIRPPTVPKGEARIRFAVSALHEEEDLAGAAVTIADLAEKLHTIQ